jgi:FkbM family methyltransferase
MTIKKYRTSLGTYYLPDTGADAVANEMRQGHVFEPEIVDVAKQFINKSTSVLDLGSNFGQMSIIFSKLVGNEGKVYSFEAAPDIFEIFTKNISANDRSNIVAVCNAVYNTTGEKKIYPIPDFKRFSSYGSYGIDPNAVDGRAVETIAIDSMDIREPISFMKVDVQGSDLFAMQGAKETIMRNRMPIIFEFEEQFQKDFGTTFTDYMRFVDEEIGYKVIEVIYGINYLIIPKEMPIPDLMSMKRRRWNMIVPNLIERLYNLKRFLGIKTIIRT